MERLRIEALGALRVRRVGGEVDIGPPQQAQLLGILVARPGRPVEIDRLIDLLWGDAPPSSARNTLHKYVSALRRILEPDLPARAEGSYLRRRGEGYALLADEETLDLLDFRARVASARQSGDAPRALDGYIAALELWNGPAGAGIARRAGSASASAFAVIDAEILEVVVEASALAQRRGASERILPWLRLAAETEPLHEPIHAALILALGAAGNRAEALSVYRDVRDRLADQLGVDPGSGLADAYLTVLDPSVDRIAAVASTRADRTVSAEPQRVRDFEGRAAESGVIRDFLAREPVWAATLVISGPPGAGKTTTALEVLRREGVPRYFVNLHGIDPVPLTPLEVLRTLLTHLDRDQEPPGTLDDALAAWRDAAASMVPVIVLDNAASEAQVRPVLNVDAPIRVIVTSRRTLAGLGASERILLGPLERTASRELLAGLIPPTRRSEDELDELAALCGDLPLALRIAGARIGSRPQWTVGDFITRLRDERERLGHLVAGDLAVEIAFSLSYNALDTASRSLFRSLSLLHGASFTAIMAAAIDGMDPRQCRERLDALADVGLVELVAGNRYGLHDLIRVFAADRLRDESSSQEIAKRRSRLDRWVLQSMAEAARSFPDSWSPVPVPSTATEAELQDARRWLTMESAHWVQAFERAAEAGDDDAILEAAMAAKGVASEWWTWGVWPRVHELGVRSASAIGDQHSHVVQLVALASAMAGDGSDPDASDHPARRALAAAEALGDRRWIAESHTFLAEGYMSVGDAEGCISEARLALAEFEALGHVGGQIGLRSLLAKALARSDEGEALKLNVETLAMIDGLGPEPEQRVQPVELHNAFTVIVQQLLRLERFDDALVIARRMLRISHWQVETYTAFALRHEGFALMGLGQDDAARTSFDSAMELAGPYPVEIWADGIREALTAIAVRTAL